MADDKEKEKEKEPFFKLYNLDAVEKIKKDEKIDLPQRKLSIPKDERWNEKQMASKTMQGILNGDSIKTISKSMEEVVKNNEVSAMRIARTMHTSAENAGRLQSFKDLAEQGVVQKKVWQATPDDRVRASHLDIDGEEQDIDKPFSNGCMFPGDGKGPSDEVWNCRCAMSDHIIGFRRKDGSISEVKYKGEETLHDKQIREERTRRGTTAAKSSTPKASSTVVNGKDITDTWTRREDKFDFEIEDVINAQGFDGKPRIVDAEEFDRYVQESNFIAQRTYSAPNKEILDAYREQLYNGKWYVDCSTGGAQYGQGMYCAADYNGTLTNGIKSEMNHYQNLSTERLQKDAWYAELKARAQNATNDEDRVFYTMKSDPDLTGYKLPEKDKEIWQKMINGGGWMSRQFDLDDLHDEFVENYSAPNYTETLTLDKSAKIIKYDDLVEMKNNEKPKSDEELFSNFFDKNVKDNSKFNDTEKSILYHSLNGFDDKETNLTTAKYAEIYDKATEDMPYKEVKQMRKDAYRKIDSSLSGKSEVRDMEYERIEAIKNMNLGSYATLKGYDAINAEGHGESGSYTVILNRTKVIIKEDKYK